jgi:hypothetical protein
MSTIKINELASSAISLTDFFAKADASGVANKNTIQGLSNFLNTVGTLAFKGVLLAADAAVTEDGIYVAGDAGTYTNNGGLVITVNDKIVLISVTGTQTVFEKAEFPITLTIDAVPTSGSTNVPQSGGTSTYVRNQIDVKILKKPNLTIGKNLYNKDTNIEDYRVSSFDGTLVSQAGYEVTQLIPVLPSTEYKLPRFQFLAYYDIDLKFISALSGLITAPFTTPVNSYYLRFSDTDLQMSNNQLELGATSTTVEDYSEKLDLKYLQNNNLINETTVYVRRNTGISHPITGGTFAYTGRTAVQDAINAYKDVVDYRNRVTIVPIGKFEAFTTAHYTIQKGVSGLFAFIYLYDYISVKGLSSDTFIIDATLPNNLGVGFAYKNYQAIYLNSNFSSFENATVISNNSKYPIHIDDANFGLENFETLIKNVVVKKTPHTGDAVNWTSETAIGLGMSSGQQLTYEEVHLISPKTGLYIHNNCDFIKPCVLKLKNCTTESLGGNQFFSINVQNFGSGTKDQLILENTIIGEGAVSYEFTHNISERLESQYANTADTSIIANDIVPRPLYNINNTAKALRITSNSIGGGSSVTIDATSTAFDAIIGNSLSPYTTKDIFGRTIRAGYTYFVGGNALSGYAFGSKDISEVGCGEGVDVFIKSLGKRLGDCSVTSKTLTVTIDGGSPINIVFNLNYTSVSNASIISDINTALGASATASEYAPAREYYPQFKGVKQSINVDSSEILVGMGIVLTSTGMKKATNADGYINGICLDNVKVGDVGRIITEKGSQIYTANASSFTTFFLNETSVGTRLAGTKFGISATAGVFEVNATPTLLRCKYSQYAEIL